MRNNLFWESETPRVELARVAGWTIPAIVRERARREPKRPVYSVPEHGGYRRVDWETFGRMVVEISAGLAHLGFEIGDCAAVMGDPTLDWVTCDFGALGAGGACVGIYQTSSWQEVMHIVEDARPKAFFGEKQEHVKRALQATKPLSSLCIYVLMKGTTEGLETVTEGAHLVTLADLRRMGAAAIAADPSLVDRRIDQRVSGDLARIIYTSGTTGRPKGVMYTHEAWLLVGEQWVLRYPSIRAREHAVVAFLSTAHVSSAMVTEIVPLVSKLLPHFAPESADLMDVFRAVRPEVLGMTPQFFQKIAVQLALKQEKGSAFLRALHRLAMRIGRAVVHERWDGHPIAAWRSAVLAIAQRTLFRRLLATAGLDRVRRAQTGSAMMPVEVATMWAVWGVDIREAYGLSEAACAVAYQQNSFPRPGTIGRLMEPQPGTELVLATDGEILFKSPMLFSGYWNAPEATAKALRDGWFHTGDLAERTASGDLRLIGRKNDAISTAGGKTINPAEIENELKLSPYISEAVIFGHGEKYLTALIELEFGNVAAWAKDRGHTATAYTDLAAIPAVVELIEKEISVANEKFGRALQVKKFRIIPLPLDNVNDALTSAKKVKRRVVREYFHDMVETMYDRSENEILAASLRK